MKNSWKIIETKDFVVQLMHGKMYNLLGNRYMKLFRPRNDVLPQQDFNAVNHAGNLVSVKIYSHKSALLKLIVKCMGWSPYQMYVNLFVYQLSNF